METTNFHQLYLFYTVARLGSFSKAASELSISQPAASIQVRELEKSMDCLLLHRMRRGLQLTDIGSEVFCYAQQIFSLAEEMQNAVNETHGLRSGRLSIGSSTTPGEYILPWAIGQFRRRYPGIDVSLSISNTQTVVQKIHDREFDLGMAGAPVSQDGLVSFTYIADNIAVIAAPTHPLAGKRLALADLNRQDFIMREQPSATRAAAEGCLAERSVELKMVMELGSNEAVKRAVAAGLGLGMISKFGVMPDVAAGAIVVLSIEGWRCERPLTVFHRDDKHLPAAPRECLRFLQDERPLPDVP